MRSVAACDMHMVGILLAKGGTQRRKALTMAKASARATCHVTGVGCGAAVLT